MGSCYSSAMGHGMQSRAGAPAAQSMLESLQHSGRTGSSGHGSTFDAMGTLRGSAGIKEKLSAASMRRRVLPLLLLGGLSMGCSCATCMGAQKADAMAQLVAPGQAALKKYDTPRNPVLDVAFARGMACGMVEYERAQSQKKRQLFNKMLKGLPASPTVVEVGMGSFPNALYLKQLPPQTDLVGVDPNDSMEQYARENANKADLLRDGTSLRITHGVAEALPLESGIADAVVCTLTLCSVQDPDKAVSEIKRVLKPGGKFLFLEHVKSETDPEFAEEQVKKTPSQVARADGCHLDRRTLQTIKAAGFGDVDAEYYEIRNFGYLNPTVAGIATA